MTPTIHSPLALLFAKIKAEMVANGTPFADAAAETAFRTWLQAAWLDSGCTLEHWVFTQPNTSTAIQFDIGVHESGNKVNIWWGDGDSNTYAPDGVWPMPMSHTYSSAGLRAGVVLGRVKTFSSDYAASTSFGGLSPNWPELKEFTVWGNNTLHGKLTAWDTLERIYLWGSNTVDGLIPVPPAVKGVSIAGLSTIAYPTVPGLHTWPNGLVYFGRFPYQAGIFTSAMMDALLIDLTQVQTWGDGASIDAAGNCGAPTSASSWAIDILLGKGVAVNTN